jgi:parallel beta-helix repeat protein
MKTFILIIAICAVTTMASSPALAVTHHVPTDFASIQSGLNASSSGDTVLVQPGTYFENIVWPPVNGIKLVAAGDSSSVFIDGNQVGRVLTMSSGGVIDTTTLIQGFTIRNGSIVGENGGGIYCYQSSPTISECAISGNTSDGNYPTGRGGGIYCFQSDPTISDCTISENSSDGQLPEGGGIYCFQSNPTVSDCTISENSASDTWDDGRGGGIHCYYSSPTISRCTVSGNSAYEYGGGIYCYQSNPTISNCTISENSAERGGGINGLSSSNITINNCSVSGNSADLYGGGIYIVESNATISNCTISVNSAEAYGGGIFGLGYSNATINDCDIFENSTSGDGGGISLLISEATISNCTLSGNSASYGGGIYCQESGASVYNSGISGNSAFNGGGIYCYYASPTINSCTISGNTASSGGGITCNYSSNPVLNDCTISENSASSGGGIVCLDYSFPTISYCSIIGNSAVTRGGGFYCGSGARPSINNCNISANSALTGGGIFSNSRSIPTINNCAVINNLGEGIYVNDHYDGDGSAVVTFSDFHNNSEGDFGGESVDPNFGVIVDTNANGDPCDAYFNISLDPLYVDPSNGDYHLQEGSPCIDAGHPDSPPDPDGTVADIGAFYFDQGPHPIIVTLTPTSSTDIPAGGGVIEFDANVVSSLPDTYEDVRFWTTVFLPNGNFYYEIQYQTRFTLQPFMDITGSISQEIPSFAPAGDYEMWGWIGMNPNRNPRFGGFFSFTKSAFTTRSMDVDNWTASGKFSDQGTLEIDDTLPIAYELKRAYPNPFNPTTTISLSLPESTDLSVLVYNVTGQQVAVLANGPFTAGNYTLTFDASGLASGLYFVRATVPGELDKVQKLMLVR